MNALAQVVARAGGPSAVASQLSCSAQAVCFYRDGKRKPPDRLWPTLERLTNGMYTCEQMRPDIVWVRIPDPAWPWHPEGRPLRDDTALNTQAEPAAEVVDVL